jgi:UDP-N-acetylmuramoyl-tripeptide--D-alanyl-D-alanine ligase
MAVAVVALVPAGARWLRVAQREHYIARSVSRFALRWWRSEPANMVLAVLGVAGASASALWPLCALAPAAAAVVGPVHLSVRGRTSRLAFTRRMKTLTGLWAALEAGIVGAGAALGEPALGAAASVVLAPALVDLSLACTAPLERRLSERYVRMAADRLRRVAPTVVAITGSYGKTSTKNHVAHLVSGTSSVVATPRSFNNRAGLARSVNEHLVEGTTVFVAEMGTYGRGEIRALCQWCPPDIAVLTAIGPVHLERFGSEDAILAAKSEIAERARVVVLNVGDRRLEALAGALASTPRGPVVVRCSAEDETADVCVRRKDGAATVVVAGERIASEVPLAPGIQPGNLACAVAVALQLGIPATAAAARIPTLSAVANRLTAGSAPSGVYVIDDTFNSNPAGARAALALLAGASVGGRRAVVTPGMIELGRRQFEENRAMAHAAAEVATDVVAVGRTNRRALIAGASSLHPVVVRTRAEAVAWVRSHLGPDDAVLYENDLPDHYP